MINVFYAKRTEFDSSSEMLKKILNERFSIFEYEIYQNENGKPFLRLQVSSLPALFFSVSHTKTAYFIAISDENIGIDAEECARKSDYAPILRKFHESERLLVKTNKDFLILWTAKESIIKWLGGTIAKDLKKICYIDGTATLNGLELPLQITQGEFYDHYLSLCSEKNETPHFEKL